MKVTVLEVTDEREIVSLEEAKEYLRISPNNKREDLLIQQTLIKGSIDLVEQYLDRDILSKRRDFHVVNPEGDYFNLPYAPIKTLGSINIRGIGKDDNKLLVENDDYLVENSLDLRAYILNKNLMKEYITDRGWTWQITYETAGIHDDSLMVMKAGILSLVAALYRERDGRSTKTTRNNYQDWLSRYKNYAYYGIR